LIQLDQQALSNKACNLYALQETLIALRAEFKRKIFKQPAQLVKQINV